MTTTAALAKDDDDDDMTKPKAKTETETETETKIKIIAKTKSKMTTSAPKYLIVQSNCNTFCQLIASLFIIGFLSEGICVFGKYFWAMIVSSVLGPNTYLCRTINHWLILS